MISESMLRGSTVADWRILRDRQAFSEHCHAFAQSEGAALVEVGRGLVSSLIRYVNAVHGLQLESPFDRLADTGLTWLMPQSATINHRHRSLRSRQ
jgi:hypothetical protein